LSANGVTLGHDRDRRWNVHARRGLRPVSVWSVGAVVGARFKYLAGDSQAELDAV
jgi:hypothetical protein